jgi:hypothetical protein
MAGRCLTMTLINRNVQNRFAVCGGTVHPESMVKPDAYKYDRNTLKFTLDGGISYLQMSISKESIQNLLSGKYVIVTAL